MIQYEAEAGGLALRASHNYGFQASLGNEALSQNKHDLHILNLIMWVFCFVFLFCFVFKKLAFVVALCHLVAHLWDGWLKY